MMTFRLRSLVVEFLFALAIAAPFACAQQFAPTQNATRRFDGWNRVVTKSTSNQPTQDPAVQTAYFQAQGSLPDGFPVIPADDMRNATTAHEHPNPVLPQSTPGSKESDSLIPPTMPEYPNPYQNGAGGLPNLPLATGAANTQRGPLSPEYPQFVSPPTQPQVQPQPSGPRNLSERPIGRDGASGPPKLRATASSTADRSLRDRNLPSTSRPQSGRLNPASIATGRPFVTPPPGRYLTSPYNHAMFQMAAYRRVQPGDAASRNAVGQLVSTQLAPRQLLAQQQFLPQYSRQPGVYPTTYQCANPPPPSLPPVGAVPGAYVPPTFTPNLTPGVYTPNNAGYSPLVSLGQENYNVLLGRGLVGQPTVYVPGQPVRNFMRYLSP